MTSGPARGPLADHLLRSARAADEGSAGRMMAGCRLVPLPGGRGRVEGCILGALALAGAHPAASAVAAVTLCRVAGYWALGGAGTIAAAVLARRWPARAASRAGEGDPRAPDSP